MKRFSIILLTLILLIPAGVAYAASQGALNVSPATVDANGTVSATGSGFQSMADVTVAFDGDGTKVIKADINGNISFSYDIPPSISKGIHSLRAEGPSNGTHADDVIEAYSSGRRVLVGNVNVEDSRSVLGEQVIPEQPVAPGAPVVVSAKGQLPYTGGTPLWALLMAGLILTVAGFSIKVFKRT